MSVYCYHENHWKMCTVQNIDAWSLAHKLSTLFSKTHNDHAPPKLYTAIAV